jgi:hypothetical protein
VANHQKIAFCLFLPSIQVLTLTTTQADGRVVALTRIRAGEECTVSYLSDTTLLLSGCVRRWILRRHWHFVCRCLGCLREHERSAASSPPDAHGVPTSDPTLLFGACEGARMGPGACGSCEAACKGGLAAFNPTCHPSPRARQADTERPTPQQRASKIHSPSHHPSLGWLASRLVMPFRVLACYLGVGAEQTTRWTSLTEPSSSACQEEKQLADDSKNEAVEPVRPHTVGIYSSESEHDELNVLIMEIAERFEEYIGGCPTAPPLPPLPEALCQFVTEEVEKYAENSDEYELTRMHKSKRPRPSESHHLPDDASGHAQSNSAPPQERDSLDAGSVADLSRWALLLLRLLGAIAFYQGPAARALGCAGRWGGGRGGVGV